MSIWQGALCRPQKQFCQYENGGIKMKKFISLLLSLTMLLSIVSIVDFSAYADTLTTGKCGENVSYSFDSSTGSLTISGTGDMTNYTYDSKSLFYNNTNIKSVVIEKGITSIGDYAFYKCVSLTNVTITDSVRNIGYSAFCNCTSLTSVTVPDSVTSIGDYAFYGCTSLTSVTIPDSVTDIGDSAFYNCKSLTNVTIPNSITMIGSDAFCRCSSLENITIPDSVTSICNHAVYECTSLTSITIPNSVTSIGSSIFYNCTSLTSIEVSGNNKNYSSLDGVLFNKNKTELITYPLGKTDSEYAIPNSVTSIGRYAFDGCTSLTSVTIPDSVASIGEGAFNGCKSLANVTIGNNDSAEKRSTEIGNSAFSECTSLSSVTIGNNVTSIGVAAFSDCSSLTSVTIPNSVTSIGSNAFYNTPYYNDKSNWNNGVLYLSNCLIDTNYNFDSTTDYIIKDGTRIIASSAFENCKSLTSVTIPDGVTSIGNDAFYGCTSLESVNYSGTKSQWKTIKISSYNNKLKNTFIKCTDGIIGNGNTVTIDNLKYKIYNDTATLVGYTDAPENLVISKNISYGGYTLNVTSIGESAFKNCTSLTSVTIPNSVTSIYSSAFENCTSLKNIIVLSSDCKFGSYIVGEKVKIYGYANSTANKYADSNGNEFIEIYCNDYGLEHIYSKKVLENPTCKNNGKISYTCDRCSKIYTDTIPALGHNYVSKVIKQPTCTEKGTTRYTCSRCGDSYDKDNIATLGHNYVSKVIKQPTCTEKGTTRYTCSRCGDYYDKEDIAALGHNYVSNVLAQPTCTEKGATRYTCTRCNNYYDKKDIEELGHDTKIVERVEPTLTEDGFYRVECQRDGCGYSSSHPLEQLTLGYNQKVKSNGSDTYKIEMDKSSYLIFDFEGESQEWNINIYDEDYNKIDTLKPVYKEFYKKSYLQISLGSNVPNKNQIVALFAGKYYVEIDRLNNATNDNFSGNYTFSIDYSPANETIKETKNDFYYDAPTAKNIELNKTYNGFLGAKYACYNYVGNPILTTDERDAYKIEIPKGSGLSQFSVTLSSKAFAPLGSNCTLILYNSEFEPYDGFKPLTVSLNSTLNETIYLYEGTYYIAVVNDNSPIEYTFTTTFKPQGTFTCVEHKGKLVNTVNPTCTQNGYNSYVCQICGAQYNEIIPAYGHNAVIDYEVAPTLVSSGLTRGSHCSICGAVITPQTVIPQISAPAQPTTTPTTAAKAVSKPKSAKIKKVKAAKKAVSVEWKKVSGVKGYQVQVATDKKFKKNKKTATVKKQKTTKVTIKKLKAKKKYYVRIRTYKTVKGKKIYSSWSKVKSVKTK